LRCCLLVPARRPLCGWGNTGQTSSGKEYLASCAAVDAKAGKPFVVTGEAVRKAGGVEPSLRFPARLGLARMEGGRLTGIPKAEVAVWHDLARRNRRLGEFVPISPIIAAFTANTVGGTKTPNGCAAGHWSCGKWRSVGDIVSTIRLGAARQHVDAVLIYEVSASSRNNETPLAFADFSIIGGAILPTRVVSAGGIAQALLLDVRNGYPYGTARAEVDLSKFTPSWGSNQRTEVLRGEASLKVVYALVPEVDEMLSKLKTGLSKRAKARQ